MWITKIAGSWRLKNGTTWQEPDLIFIVPRLTPKGDRYHVGESIRIELSDFKDEELSQRIAAMKPGDKPIKVMMIEVVEEEITPLTVGQVLDNLPEDYKNKAANDREEVPF